MKKVWLWALLSLPSGAAILLGVLYWRAETRASAILDRHRLEVIVKTAQLTARRSPHIIQEDPWPRIQALLAEVNQFPAEEREDLEAASRGNPDAARDSRLSAALPGYLAFLERLEAQLPVDPSGPPYPYGPGETLEVGRATGRIVAFRFLEALARGLHYLARDREALDTVLLALRLEAYLSRGAPLMETLLSAVGEVLATEAMRAILAEHALSVEDLKRTSEALDRIYRDHPRTSQVLDVEDLMLRRVLLERKVSDLEPAIGISGGSGRVRLWTYGFSEKSVRAEALEALASAFRGLRELELRSTAGPLQAARRSVDEALASRNALARTLVEPVVRSWESLTPVRVHRTMMRSAIAVARFRVERGTWPGAIQDLVPDYLAAVPVCPISGLPLRVEPGKLWSAGRDGDDDGGRPTPTNDFEDADGDFVWTIQRR